MEPGTRPSGSASASTAAGIKNVSCQELLKKRPLCHGWVRRKSAIQQLGSMVEVKLKIGRKSSLVNRFSWQQRYAILTDGMLYVFSEETAPKAQKVIQLADYVVLTDAPEERNKEVLFPFKLEPREQPNNVQYLSATSEDEFEKWKRLIRSEIKTAGARRPRHPRGHDDSDSGCDEGSTGDSSSINFPHAAARNRPLPSPPCDTGAANVKKKPIATPTTQGRAQACAKRHEPTPAKKTHKPPPVRNSCQVPEMNEPDDTYEIAIEPTSAVDSAMWYGPPDGASRVMAQITENGVFLIRQSIDSAGYTLMVIVDGKSCKFKISENKQNKTLLFQNVLEFDSLPDIVSYYTEHNLPNKSVSLSKPYTDVVEVEYE